MEPRLASILSYIKQTNPFCETTIFSNMGAWSQEQVERIVRDGNLDCLVTSFYGPTQALHEKYQPGVGWKNALNGLKMWRETRTRLGKTKPVITSHYVAIPELMDHLPEFLTLIRPYVDSAGYNHYDTFHGDAPDLGDNQRYFGEPAARRVPCHHLWSAFNVLCNGDVVPCCLDYDICFPVGNIFTESAEAIWRGEKFEALRQLHVEGRQSENPLCKNCTFWMHEEAKSWVDLWLKQ